MQDLRAADPIAARRAETEEFNKQSQALKERAQKFGHEIDEKDYNSLHPHADKQARLDTIRFVGVLIFNFDFMFKLAVLRQAKFSSVYIRDLYKMFIWVRIVFIALYHFFFILMMGVKVTMSAIDGDSKKKKRSARIGPASAENPPLGPSGSDADDRPHATEADQLAPRPSSSTPEDNPDGVDDMPPNS